MVGADKRRNREGEKQEFLFVAVGLNIQFDEVMY